MLFWLLIISRNVYAGRIVSYPLPSCYTPSTQAYLTIDSENIPVIRFTKIYDYAHFSFSGDITITITASEPITTYQVSPLAYNIKATVNGNKLTFHLILFISYKNLWQGNYRWQWHCNA